MRARISGGVFKEGRKACKEEEEGRYIFIAPKFEMGPNF